MNTKYYFFCDQIEPGFLTRINGVFQSIRDGESIETLVSRHHVVIPMKWHPASSDAIYDPLFMEALGLISFIAEKHGLPVEKAVDWITVVTFSDAFLIVPSGIYHCGNDEGGFEKVYPSRNDIRFVTTRDSFHHPFFYACEKLFAHDTGFDIRSIQHGKSIGDAWPHKDKMDILLKCHSRFPEYVGPIAVPYYRWKKKRVIQSMLNIIRNEIGQDIMIKRNFGCAGENMRALRLTGNMNVDTLESVMREYFSANLEFSGSYACPYYAIKREWRAYYLKHPDTGQVRIYSAKLRKNRISKRAALDSRDFKIYATVPVQWKYALPELLSTGNERVRTAIDNIAKIVWYPTWILELIETVDGKLMLMEINYLWSGLIAGNADERHMIEYNKDLFVQLYS